MTIEAVLPPARSATRRRIVFHDHEPPIDDFRRAVVEGLSKVEKAIPCRFLYDANGSSLFDRICELPEYYPTRTETKILRDYGSAMADHIGPDALVIELGSGSSLKTRILLDALDEPCGYVPIDISRDHLRRCAQALQNSYPDLRVEAVCADYAQAFPLPPTSGRRVLFYPGSTIGNLPPDQAAAFLGQWAQRLGPGAGMLVGIDLRKSAEVLEPAYDDSAGVTAAFTLNLLDRINRELGADFKRENFEHVARYDADLGRVAIHLCSTVSQTVTLAGRRYAIAQSEKIHVEDSWKYSIGEFQDLARAGGFAAQACWIDDDALFSVHFLVVEDASKARLAGLSS